MIKLQINNLQVFERIVDLIAPTEEAKLELNGNIVQQFAEKYLKSVANNIQKSYIERATSNIQEASRRYVDDALVSMGVTGSQLFSSRTFLSDKLKADINAQIKKEFTELVQATVKEQLVAISHIDLKEVVKIAIKEIMEESFTKK